MRSTQWHIIDLKELEDAASRCAKVLEHVHCPSFEDVLGSSAGACTTIVMINYGDQPSLVRVILDDGVLNGSVGKSSKVSEHVVSHYIAVRGSGMI
jgi:hypothetical protein